MKAERALDILKVHQKYYEYNGSETGSACRIGVKAVKKQMGLCPKIQNMRW